MGAPAIEFEGRRTAALSLGPPRMCCHVPSQLLKFPILLEKRLVIDFPADVQQTLDVLPCTESDPSVLMLRCGKNKLQSKQVVRHNAVVKALAFLTRHSC